MRRTTPAESARVTWQLAGRVAVVTGASSGIGAATVRRLAALGMQVVAVARREDRLEQLALETPNVVPHVADVTDMASVDALAERVAAEFGACHALINNAGLGGGPFRGREDVEDALHTIDVNLSGAVRCFGAFAALLEASAPARVVNVASVAGKLGIGPAGYGASKFGLVGFSEATGFAWQRRGVTISQLNPGFIQTEGFPQQQVMRTPARAIVGRPEDVARAVHDLLLSGHAERTVPRWYRAFVVARHVAAPAYRSIAGRSKRAAGTRD
jgi:NAD(P)-dependent dehydrogenase (short-subunit alcohol dehydrogenase family)